MVRFGIDSSLLNVYSVVFYRSDLQCARLPFPHVATKVRGQLIPLWFIHNQSITCSIVDQILHEIWHGRRKFVPCEPKHFRMLEVDFGLHEIDSSRNAFDVRSSHTTYHVTLTPSLKLSNRYWQMSGENTRIFCVQKYRVSKENAQNRVPW